MVPIALGLTVLLLADSFALRPEQVALAATDGRDSAPGAAVGPAETTRDLLACANGFGDIRQREDMSLLGVTVTGDGAVAVGFGRLRDENGTRRRPASLYTNAGRWFRAFVPNPGNEDGLIAVAASQNKQAWAVGFTTAGGKVLPLAMRWDGRKWNVNKPGPRGSLDTMLTDVAVVGKRFPFAVGYRVSSNGKRKPVAVRRDRKRWRYVDPAVGKRESISLSGIAPDRRGGLWAVGHGGVGAVIRPKVFRRSGERWKRIKMPTFKGEAALTDVVAKARDDAWAVGYQRIAGNSRPLVMHWNGKDWKRIAAPRFDSPETILTAVSAPSSGGLWVVGSGWSDEINGHEAIAAWWDGQTWAAVAGPEAGSELRDVVGSLHNGGWAVGRAGPDARTTRVCVRAQASIFGGSEPIDQSDTTTAQSPAAAGVLASQAIAANGDVFDDDDDATIAPRDTDSSTARAGDNTGNVGKGKQRGSRKRSGRRRGPAPLPSARSDARIVARNVAFKAGVAASINSYGAIAADFDADGDDDLYIGAHGRPARLALNEDGVFIDHPAMNFPEIDRHGCAAADIDGSGMLDLYCTVGGKRGSGLKANELWIDPAGPAPVDIAAEAGVADPTGRGRLSVFLESGAGKPAELLVANSPSRVDGLPSLGRRFHVDKVGTFNQRSDVGMTPHLGALSAQDADVDGDGREDMLLVTGGVDAPRAEGTRLYRNGKRGLTDITKRSGIRAMGEVDAKLVDLNGDRHLDLVQLSERRLRVSVWKNGRFRKVWSRVLTHGRSIAAGDVDGDGRDDLYIVRGNAVRNPSDVVLINRRDGQAFSSLTIPQTLSGDGDEAVAIDHDGNGLTDFLVLNGENQRGPTQLIAFYHRGAARVR